MQLILDIGQLMMENGASSKRVVRDMLRAAAYLGIYWENVQIHITYSTIMINVDDGVTSETMFRKCYKHGVNMMTTLLANQLSWDALKSNESYLIYRNQMMTIQQMARKRLYPQWLTLFCIGMASSAFCLLFGGHWYEALYTFIAAVVGAYVKTLCERFGVNIYIGIAASAFFATATAYLTLYIPGPPCSWLPVVACALTLIPGVPLINCVDDFLSNYLNSGMTRFTQTILVMTAMTFGLSAVAVMTSVPNFTGVRIAPESLYIAQALAAAMAGRRLLRHVQHPETIYTARMLRRHHHRRHEKHPHGRLRNRHGHRFFHRCCHTVTLPLDRRTQPACPGIRPDHTGHHPTHPRRPPLPLPLRRHPYPYTDHR